jgi:cytochrome oxidase Cu insertion factor (SCO1/SenC/PrrC family)
MGSLWANRRLRWMLVVLAAALAGTAGGGIAAAVSRSSDAFPSAQLRAQLSLIDAPAKQAPGFSLVDQRGRRVSLAALRGKTVVLDFMDPRCTDICPIVSQEYLRAAGLLGGRNDRVEFLAVNVNQYHEKVADVAAFSRQHGLTRLPNWHFLTGSTPALRRIWKAYGVQVIPNPDGDVVHTSIMYFVGRDGTLRYAAMPTKDKAGIAVWGRGIAAVSGHLAG